ncbi:hypothetical protein [Armatimonas sp.]|uniref:hypothetical protein n=1 Tax=Armatimonas sp. TaxID=1872638 RepID=UPI00375283E5
METETTETAPEATSEGFHITDESAAVWLLRKLRANQEEAGAIKSATAKRLHELESDYNGLMGRFGAELENWARGEAETRRRKTITLPLAGCSVAFRISPARLELDESALEIAATLGMMKEPAPDLVAFRKHAQEQLEQTGEGFPARYSERRRRSSVWCSRRQKRRRERPQRASNERGA